MVSVVNMGFTSEHVLARLERSERSSTHFIKHRVPHELLRPASPVLVAEGNGLLRRMRVASLGHRVDPVMPARCKIHCVDAFAEEAVRFCEWALGLKSSGRDGAEEALRRISQIFALALTLPEGLPDSATEEAPSLDAECNQVVASSKNLPFDLYPKVYDPFNTYVPEIVHGSLLDDIADIFRDIATGLNYYKGGRFEEATWSWRFSFEAHWGEHASGAIRSLQRWTFLGRETREEYATFVTSESIARTISVAINTIGGLIAVCTDSSSKRRVVMDVVQTTRHEIARVRAVFVTQKAGFELGRLSGDRFPDGFGDSLEKLDLVLAHIMWGAPSAELETAVRAAEGCLASLGLRMPEVPSPN